MGPPVIGSNYVPEIVLQKCRLLRSPGIEEGRPALQGTEGTCARSNSNPVHTQVYLTRGGSHLYSRLWDRGTINIW